MFEKVWKSWKNWNYLLKIFVTVYSICYTRGRTSEFLFGILDQMTIWFWFTDLKSQLRHFLHTYPLKITWIERVPNGAWRKRLPCWLGCSPPWFRVYGGKPILEVPASFTENWKTYTAPPIVWPNFCRTLSHILHGLHLCSRTITSPIKIF